MNNYENNEIVFGTKWFKKHQSKLLWLLNAPIIKYWFRWVMRIHSFDCRKDVTIVEITPNSYSMVNRFLQNGTPEITTDFRTNDKFAKRLYYAFKPFWYLFHIIDWVAFDRYEKLAQLSFGFSTLTVYPDDDPGTTSKSSLTLRGPIGGGAGESWNSQVTGNGVSASNPAGDDNMIAAYCTTTSNQYQYMARGIFLYDTSSLTSGATISAAVLSLWGSSQANGLGASPTINIYTSNPASNTEQAAADYQTVGSTAQCDSAIAYASWSTSGYNDFTLNTTGKGNISKTSISKFSCREATYDVANSAPTWSSGKGYEMNGYYSHRTGTTNDPKLVVTYTTASGPTNLKTYNTNVTANIKTINTNVIANVKSLNTNT